MKVRLVSLIRSRSSWANVARKLAEALHFIGARVMIEEDNDGYIDTDFEISDVVERALRTRFTDPDIDLLIVRPERFSRYGGAPVQTGYMVFEADRWPRNWIALGSAYLDLILTPSIFCRDGLIASGAPKNRVAVLPHGIDPEIFRAAPPHGNDEDFRVLFVGTPSRRKGLEQLLEALSDAASCLKHVSLTIKTEQWPDRSDAASGVMEKVVALNANSVKVRFIDDVYTEREMAELYQSHDILCVPHMGEGFGMCLLEAMACGRPVVATSWSGVCDFYDSRAGWPVTDFDRIEVNLPLPPSFPCPESAGMVAPSISAITHRLIEAARSSHMERAAVGRAAAATASTYTWEKIAKQYLVLATKLRKRIAA